MAVASDAPRDGLTLAGALAGSARQVDPRAAHRHPLPPQQLGLALAHGDAAVGAHYALPWQVIRVRGREDPAHQARRRRIHIRIGAHEPLRDDAHLLEDPLDAGVGAGHGLSLPVAEADRPGGEGGAAARRRAIE